MLFGENGIITKAQQAAEATKNAQDATVNGLKNLEDQIGEALGEEKVVDINTLKADFAKKNEKAKDSLGNIVTVPKGFKVVEGSTGEEISVQNGVVIQDSKGNEFVWIPVGTVNIQNGDTKSTVTIDLARYDFTTDASTVANSRTIKQAASNYATDTPFTPTGKSYKVTEYATRDNPNGVAATDSTGRNAIAKDLKGFIESATTNGGYYLARYEASKDETDNTKPASKYDKATWTSVTQIDAALACRDMYSNTDENIGVKSDLVNSYAWDTAIIYIEKMKTANNNYANTKQGGDNPTSKLNTGKHNDVACNIHDMSGNVYEWSTEYSTGSNGSHYYPCVSRGGYYNDSGIFTASRSYSLATNSKFYIGFRSVLYVK